MKKPKSGKLCDRDGCSRVAGKDGKLCAFHGASNNSEDSVQCAATCKATGQRCKNVVAPGFTVCRFHGAKAPQTIRAANARLAGLMHPAIDAVHKTLMSPNEKTHHKLRASEMVMNRIGLNEKRILALTEGDNEIDFSTWSEEDKATAARFFDAIDRNKQAKSGDS